MTHQLTTGYHKGFFHCDSALLQSKNRSIAILAVALLACCTLVPAAAHAACSRQGEASRDKLSAQQHGQFQLAADIEAGEGDDVSIVGLWHVYFVANGQPFDEGFDQWHSDGTEILNDTAPPQPANGAGTVCLGVYKKIGASTYKLRHPFWIFDDQGNLAGNGVFLEVVTVNRGGKTYDGTFAFITYDAKGNTTSQIVGDVKAQRITVD